MRVAKIPYEPGDTIAAPHTTYRVVRALGAGGMGFVVEAVDKNLNARVVLKMLHPELARERPSLRDRFRKEAMACAQLSHPCIVRVLVSSNLEDEVKTPFYAMEYLDGDSVREALDRRGALRIDVAINIAINVLHGLHHMHKRGIVHRDVKPDNVIVHKDEHTDEVLAKLIDLGVMRLLDDTTPEGFCGTPAYAAPEQLRDAPVATPIDVFAAATVLFEMLTGKRPYASFGTGERAALARIDVVAPRLTEVDASFPPALDDIVALGLALDPAKRPSAFDFAHKLEEIVRALNKTFARGIVTKESFGRGVRKEENAQAITVADLEAPTDPWGPVPPWMQALRQDAEIAQALGHAPPAPAGASPNTIEDAPPLPFADTDVSPLPAAADPMKAFRAAPTRESPRVPSVVPLPRNGTEPLGAAPVVTRVPNVTDELPGAPLRPSRTPRAPTARTERELAARLAAEVREVSPSVPARGAKRPSRRRSWRRSLRPLLAGLGGFSAVMMLVLLVAWALGLFGGGR